MARTYRDEVDQILWSWPTVCRVAESDWAKGFAASIARQARNPRWRPSPKQFALMKTMVTQAYQRRLSDEGEDFDVIEQ